MGTKERLKIVIPFNTPNDQPTQITLDERGIFPQNLETISIDGCNQYTLQAEALIKSIFENTKEPVKLEKHLPIPVNWKRSFYRQNRNDG